MPTNDDAAGAASFGFAAGAAWTVALGMALDTPVPAPVWAPLFVALAAVTMRWASGWVVSRG